MIFNPFGLALANPDPKRLLKLYYVGNVGVKGLIKISVLD